MKNLLYLLLLALFIGCDGGNQNDYDGMPAGEHGGYTKEAVSTDDVRYYGEENREGNFNADLTDANGGAKTIEPAPEKTEVIEQKIIKTGNVSIQVKDFEAATIRLHSYVKFFNGYISNETRQNSSYQTTGTITIRVPSNSFDALMDSISGYGTYLANRSVSAKDVTEEFVDVAARLKTRKAVEQRYIELLQKAKNIEEMLKVEAELKKIREEIEAAQGRLQYLQSRVSYSTVHLTYYTDKDYQAPPDKSFWAKLGYSFERGWGGLLAFILGVTRAWPFILILTVGLIILIKYLRRRS